MQRQSRISKERWLTGRPHSVMFFKILTASYNINNKQKNSQIPSFWIPMICMYCSGIMPTILICVISSVAIKRHTEKSIAALRIAPSMPTQLLNLCSLIARRTPRSVSSVTAISRIRMNELLDNKNKING